MLTTEISFSEAHRKKVLIVGEVKSGKTSLTAKLLREAIDYTPQVTLIELSPTFPLPEGVGTSVESAFRGALHIRTLRPHVVFAPRLQGKSRDEVLRLAEMNRLAIDEIFAEYLDEASDALFVNDVSIYLQAGSVERVLQVVASAKTVILNGYYGSQLSEDHGSGVSDREKSLMDMLALKMDMVIRLPTRP